MADTSERIIILSAVILVIILWIPNSGLIQTIVTINDVEIEIDTTSDYYFLGDSFTTNVYLVNSRSRDVWMEPIKGVMFRGFSAFEASWPIYNIVVMDGRLHIPAKSKVFLIDRHFTPRKVGEFYIQCSGVRKTVVIFESKSENETVNAIMNTHSFTTEMEATLFITNVGINDITFGFEYQIKKKVVEGFWEEVFPFPSPSAWPAVLYGLKSGKVFHQKIKIDTLETGQYRLSKNVYDELTQEQITLFVEFEIQEFLEQEYAWITATILTVELSPSLDIVELSSEDKDIPHSLFKAIDKALEVEFTQEAPTPEGPQRKMRISINEAESIIRYFVGYIEKDRQNYEFYVSHGNTNYSILIQFYHPLVTS